MLTFLNKGFIVTETQSYVKGVVFIDYTKIGAIRMINVREDVYRIEIVNREGKVYKEGKENLYEFSYQNKTEGETTYNDVLSHWIKYLNESSTTSLEQKLDTLLSHIDIIPGGKEYDLAKQNFEER